MPIERKLAAIMFTDIAGYTAQMSKDEAVAISLLNKQESVLKPLIAKHNGTYVKSTGDGSLSHFNSAVDAATCAKRFQESIYDDKDLNVRVGVHLGDTIFEKGDIRGDGVNIASRLESMAVEGGVFVSKEVHDQLANQKEFEGISLGLQSMKGVGRLIEVFGLKGNKLSEPNPSEYQDNKIDRHSDDEVPSIAIIPFRNKGKKEDAFYAYGICADLITDCSNAGLIRVASLEDIEKVENWDKLKANELAFKLFVRYIAQGTLWKMDDVFQLSIELYDTKESKVVWSDRWQEEWNNLPTIKGNLSDGLLKALDTESKVEKKVEIINTEAYEYYLKGMYKSIKSENMEDMEIVRGLFQKAIDLDNNLFEARGMLGYTNIQTGDYDNAMKIFTSAYKQVKKIGEKRGIGYILGYIGLTHYLTGDSDKAFDYYTQSIKIKEEIGVKRGLGLTFTSIGRIYLDKGDYAKALDYYERSFLIFNELGDNFGLHYSLLSIGIVKRKTGGYDKALDYFVRTLKINEKTGHKYGMGASLNGLGSIYADKGDYEKALDYYNRSLTIQEELDNKREMVITLGNIGNVYYNKRDYPKAEEYLEKSLAVQKEIGNKEIKLEVTTYLCLSYKKLSKEFDGGELHRLIEKAVYIEFTNNYRLYQLLEDTSYLETAYNQVQELADNLEDNAKFLSYPIPKAIVKEWEKVK